MDWDEHLTLSRKFFINQKKSMERSMYSFWYDTGLHVKKACYGGYDVTKVPVSYMFYPHEEFKDWEVFWNWLISDTSPWKIITREGRGVTLIRDDDGHPLGVSINEEVLQDDTVPRRLIKNFAICIRMISEKEWKIRGMVDLVNLGLPPEDAFFLCSNFIPLHFSSVPKDTRSQPAKDYQRPWVLSDVMMDSADGHGCHWPVTTSGLIYRYFRGGINKNGSGLNGFFTKSGSPSGGYDPEGTKTFFTPYVSREIGETGKVKSKFSAVFKNPKLEDILRVFPKFKKEILEENK